MGSMMNTAIDAREFPFPVEARKPDQKSAKAFSISGRGFSIQILYAHEPFNEDGSIGVHVSISYCAHGKPASVTPAVIKVVQRLIEQQGLRWPEIFDSDWFDAGPFARMGKHIWEMTSKTNNEQCARPAVKDVMGSVRMETKIDQQTLNRQHAEQPQPGDFWHDMYSPVCVVLGVAAGMVVYCDTTKPTDEDHWTWDLSAKRKAKTLAEFREWLSYKSEKMAGKFWASVIPRRDEWVLEHLED